MKITVKFIVIGLFVLLAIQLIPYGKDHTNPPIAIEPYWNTPETRILVKTACFDCHSYETVWPWYSKIAPVSWLIYYDVQTGRNKLNFSDWHLGKREGESPTEMAKEIIDGGMPPLQYRLTHPSSRLSLTNKKKLIEGLQHTENSNGIKDL